MCILSPDFIVYGVPDYEHCCKLGRMADKYDLSAPVLGGSINRALVARWKGEAEFPESSIRSLVKWFNQQIMMVVYSEHGRSAREYQLKNDYEALTADDDDDDSEHQKLTVRSSLKEDDIDPDELTSDFVSTATLHRHLTNCLGESKRQNKEQKDWEETKIKFTKKKAVEQIQDALRSLDNKGKLDGGSEADVDVEIYVKSPDSSITVSLPMALARGYISEELRNKSDEDDQQTQNDMEANS